MTENASAIIISNDTSSLKTIIDSIPVATLIIGPDGRFIDCNKATLQIFDANSYDILGKPPGLLSPEKQRNGKDSDSESRKYIKRAHESGSATFYFDHKTLTGTAFLAKVTLGAILYEGKPCLMTTITDMTGQVRLEENEALIGQNPNALLKLNPDLTIADLNPAFIKISGYKKEEWIGRTLNEFKIVRHDGPNVIDAIRTRTTVFGKIIVDFPNGIKNMEYSYVPVFDSDGNVILIYDILTDLTELVEEITEVNSLISENPASIITMDPSGKIISANPAFLSISHIHEEKLLSMRIQEFNILKREGLPFIDIIKSKKTAKGRLVVDFGWAVKVLDSTYIPVLDANSELTSLVAMYIDVSEQVAYIDEIETFIRENPHAILTMDPDMKFTNVNPAFTHIMGYSYEESMRMKLTDIKILEREGQSLKDAIQSKKPAKGRIVIDTPAGIRHLDIIYIPILDKKGTIIRFLEIFSDMTAISNMVKYLEQSVEIVQDNISSLAKGDTAFVTKILDADEHSASAREQFVKIGGAIDTAKQAIITLVNDSNNIAKAAIAGNMKFRADPLVHEGDYRAIIDGMNQTLDSIIIPVREAMNIANIFARYDFSVRFNPNIDIKGDWIGFKEALNNIGLQVSGAISLIKKSVSDLAASAEEANASIEEVLAGAHQIAVNTGKVSQNAVQGGDGIVQVLKAMEDLNVTVAEVSQKAESVSIASDGANSLAKGGIDLAKQSEQAMSEITVSTNEVDTIVTDINSQMNEIGKIVRLISDIANQTNLLALNAAIEAARAGEAGRGFAVVAAEVKSLAQDSRKSAENIEDMIATLQNKAKDATEAMGKSTHAVRDGSSALEQTLLAFNEIAKTIEEINQNIGEVASASEEQAASVEEVTASIQEVSNLVQNTSHEAGDAAAATEEASASIDEIGRIMNGGGGIV